MRVSLTNALVAAPRFLVGASSVRMAEPLRRKVTGAGLSFRPPPAYAKWADAYNKANRHPSQLSRWALAQACEQIRGKTVGFSERPMRHSGWGNSPRMAFFNPGFQMVIGRGVVPSSSTSRDRAGQVEIERPGSSATSIPRKESRVGTTGDRGPEFWTYAADAKIAVVRRR